MSSRKKAAAWVAGIASTVITTVAIAWLSPAPTPSPAPSDQIYPAPQPVPSVDFFVTDELGPGQISEQVAVVVDGRSVGTLTVDAVHPNASLTVTMPRSGTYGYEARTTTYVEDANGDVQQTECRGAGALTVTAGRSFALYCDYGNGVLTLE